MIEFNSSSITTGPEERPEINRAKPKYFGGRRPEDISYTEQHKYYDDFTVGLPFLDVERDSMDIVHDYINIANFPARVVEVIKDNVIVDCLIQKEPNKIFQKRVFRKRLFNGISALPGSLLLISLFDGVNESKMKIHEGRKFNVKEEDFDLGPEERSLSELPIFKNIENNF
jgi:hypothetical protein